MRHSRTNSVNLSVGTLRNGGANCGQFCSGVTLGESLSGSNSVVESQLPKLLVAGSIPVSRSISYSSFRNRECQ